MAYKINNTFGTQIVGLEDGTLDTTTTDLALFGKGYAGFGEKLNENLVKLLENFNNTSAPTNKITGQMWYDQTNKHIPTVRRWKDRSERQIWEYVLKQFIMFILAAFSIEHAPLPQLDMAVLMPLVMALLGMAGIRSFDKLKKTNSG